MLNKIVKYGHNCDEDSDCHCSLSLSTDGGGEGSMYGTTFLACLYGNKTDGIRGLVRNYSVCVLS